MKKLMEYEYSEASGNQYVVFKDGKPCAVVVPLNDEGFDILQEMKKLNHYTIDI